MKWMIFKITMLKSKPGATRYSNTVRKRPTRKKNLYVRGQVPRMRSTRRNLDLMVMNWDPVPVNPLAGLQLFLLGLRL